MTEVKIIEDKLLKAAAQAISAYNMIQHGDRVMACLSGGKDSYTMLCLLNELKKEKKFELFSYTLDQSQPGWDDGAMRAWMDDKKIPYAIEKRDTYSIVKEKIPEGKTYCSLCSRLRRGNIYRYAREHGFNKVALGHHRDDLVHTLLMSILYGGSIQSMPPKLLTDDQSLIVIRPMAYCSEADIVEYAKLQRFPIIPCTLCGSQENLSRKKVARWVQELAADNPNIQANILNALSNVSPSQLMDRDLFSFWGLEAQVR